MSAITFRQRGGQGAGRMTLCRVGAFLFVNFVQDQVLEEVPQLTLDVEGRLVPPETSPVICHSDEPQPSTSRSAVLGCVRHCRLRLLRQDPLAPCTSFPEPRARLSVLAGFADADRLTLLIDKTQTALWAAKEAVVAVREFG